MRNLSALLLTVLLASAARGEPDAADVLRRAQAAMAEHEYRTAEALLRDLLRREPDHLEAGLHLVAALDTVGEGREALARARRLEKRHPDRAATARTLGNLLLTAEGPEAARPWFEKALARDPKDAGSHLGLASAALRSGDLEEAERRLRLAEGLAPGAVGILVFRSAFHHAEKDMDASARTIAAVLQRSPWNLTANAMAAGGLSESSRPLYRPPWTPRLYDRRIRKAQTQYRSRRFEEAETAFARLDTPEAHDGRPPFFRGLVALRSGETRTAIGHLKRAVEREPDNFTFRNAYVRTVRLHIARQRAENGGGADSLDRTGALADRVFRLEPIHGVERLVRGYEKLLPREQQVVLRAVRPFRRYLPVLLEKGVTHDILGLEERIGDAPERRELRTGRSVDGRWLAAVRGKGDHHAATGLEFLLEAARLREDIFAHEFAHQVHRIAFSEERQDEIRRLYDRAMVQDRCLRAYARTNDGEYFAVAYEAFVSVVKSPWLPHSDDRAKLRAVDPELYAFLLEVTDTPDPDPMLDDLREPILEFYEWSGHEGRLKQARALFSTR